MSTSTATVGTAPVLIFAPQAAVQTVIINNTSPTTVFLGQTGVTAATGFPLQSGQTISLPNMNYNLYAVSAAGSVKSPSGVIDTGGVLQGGTAIPIASGGASFTTGMTVAIQDGNNSEVVAVTAGSTGTSVHVTATAFAHLAGVTFGQLSGSNNGSVRVVSGV